MLAVLGAAGCKKNRNQFLESDERGRLRKIAENLEDAYAGSNLPPLAEPVSLQERIDKWDDFRSCTVRTYVARKRDADRAAKDGRARSARHASIGDETVEECAVQLAVAKKDAEICERLAADYAGPNLELPLPAVRCWDTRARVFGLPDECPVVTLGSGQVGRNPECVAVARRDQSLCPYTDSPGRCRALLTNDLSTCRGPEGSPDCELAFEYWHGLIPAGFGKPLLEPGALVEKPLKATFQLRWPKNEHPNVRIEAPSFATALSWPAGKVKTVAAGATGEDEKLWGFSPPVEMAQVTWNSGTPALKLGFQPSGLSRGARPLQPPSRTAPATFVAVWADDPAKFLRCQPGPATTGELVFDAGAAQAGSFVDGGVKAQRLTCSDGTEADLEVEFRLLIMDQR